MSQSMNDEEAQMTALDYCITLLADKRGRLGEYSERVHEDYEVDDKAKQANSKSHIAFEKSELIDYGCQFLIQKSEGKDRSMIRGFNKRDDFWRIKALEASVKALQKELVNEDKHWAETEKMVPEHLRATSEWFVKAKPFMEARKEKINQGIAFLESEIKQMKEKKITPLIDTGFNAGLEKEEEGVEA